MNHLTSRRWLSLVLMIVAVISLGLVACQAAMETKQGALGEFCNNRDSDCREGLVCNDGVCVTANPAITDGCDRVCAKVDECGLDDPNCLRDCQKEIENWGEGVIETFSDCIADDLSCDEMGGSTNAAAQTCYDRLPLDETRVDRCVDFVREVQDCRPNADTTAFAGECRYRARTASDERWSRSDDCLDAIEFGTCTDTLECINSVFALEDEQRF
jgi:hypothetical protein